MPEIVLLLVLVFLVLFVLIMGGWLLLSFVGFIATGVPYVPVPQAVSDAVAAIVQRTAKANVVFYDIGSGDGRVPFSVAKTLPEAKVTGMEISLAPFLLSLILRAQKKLGRVQLLFRDAHHVSFSDGTHIFMYLFPRVVETLYPKLVHEVAKGTVIVSCDFPLKDVSPIETEEVITRFKKYTLYIYIV